MFPGPVTRSTLRHGPAPYANIAIAWAPPTAYTSSTPSSAQAARIVGCGTPPLSAWGEDVSAIDSTPATCAGTTFMTTLDTSGARPPGTYSPTREIGTISWLTVPPGTTCVTTS